MTSIRNITRFLTLGILAAVLLVGRAEAATITLIPQDQNVGVGTNFSVNVSVSDLIGQSVGGVSFLLGFDSSVLQGTGFTLDPNAKMGFALNPQKNPPTLTGNDFGSGFGAGGGTPFEAFFVADISLDDAMLQALQGSSFTLATINFMAIAPGFSPLTLSVEPTQGIFLSDGNGAALPSQATGGSVCVGDAAGVPGNCQVAAVPEPGTFALIGTGIAALVRRRRKAAQARA